jgi:hypothetical protein
MASRRVAIAHPVTPQLFASSGVLANGRLSERGEAFVLVGVTGIEPVASAV